MDAMSFISEPGVTTSAERFLNTIRMLKHSAWNAFPCRHYFGMMSVEQTDGGWTVSMAPIGAGETVNTTFYSFDEEEKMALDVARKMHPTLICACSSPHTCFKGDCPVRPAV